MADNRLMVALCRSASETYPGTQWAYDEAEVSFTGICGDFRVAADANVVERDPGGTIGYVFNELAKKVMDHYAREVIKRNERNSEKSHSHNNDQSSN